MGDSADELRALLQQTESSHHSTTATPHRRARETTTSATTAAADVPLDELATLISSLDVDIGNSPMRIVRNRTMAGPGASAAPSSSSAPAPSSSSSSSSGPLQPPIVTSSRSAFTPAAQKQAANSSVSSGSPRSMLQTVAQQASVPTAGGHSSSNSNSNSGSNHAGANDWDYTVLKFGTEVSLRGRLGRYLTSVPVLQPAAAGAPGAAAPLLPAPAPAAPPAAAALTKTFLLGVEGQGIGEAFDCFVFVNAENREDISPIRYGMTVAVKAPAAKERLLGVREGTKPGFWRNLIGAGEKWVVLQASSRGLEEAGSRGHYVRAGDRILLQTSGADNLLTLHEGATGAEARLIHKDRAGLGAEVWQLDQFAVPSLPAWLGRMYLSGRYLVTPPSAKVPPQEIVARTFPGASAAGGAGSAAALSVSHRGGGTVPGAPPQLTPPPSQQQQQQQQHTPPPLSSLTPGAQHAVLLREILLALSGIEGHYVRVAATGLAPAASSSSSGSGSSSSGRSGSASSILRELNLVVESDTADRTAASQVALLLPICEGAVQLREFIRVHSRYEFGLVSHALAAAIKAMLREFDILVAQLEHLLSCGRLSLQKMVYLLQPTKTTLRLLEKLVRRLRDCAGGRLVDGLHACFLEQGDERARQLHGALLNRAAEPFLKMLSAWLFRGELQDPYREFMVFEDTSVSKEALQDDFNAQYWESRYTLRDSHVPKLLRPLAQKALTAGKYLNVVRDCVGDGDKDRSWGANGAPASSRPGARRKVLLVPATSASAGAEGQEERLAVAGADVLVITLPHERALHFDLDGSNAGQGTGTGGTSLARAIEDAYQFSSRALLSLLEEQYCLRAHLRSLSRFFLLEHGDFFIQFMDIAEDELRKDVREVSLSRVQGLLQLAIQTSTLATDPNREDLTCSLAQHNLIQHLHLIQSAGDAGSGGGAAGGGGPSDAFLAQLQAPQGLKGVEALTLDYQVGWPVSLVLSRRAITKYQLLSRLLYFSKHVELKVQTSWQDHQSTRRLNVRSALGQCYCLRHRMLHFLQNFVYYMTLEVIGPREHEMQAGLSEARDMDQVLGLHERFLDTCLKQCLLASQDLLKTLTKLMTTCLLFADQMKRFVASSREAGDNAAAAAASAATGKGAAAVAARRERDAAEARYIRQETGHPAFQSMLVKFEDTFNAQLREFLERLWADSHRNHPQLINLCVRLDYNGYYTEVFVPEAAVHG